jgi:hypothetical protein
MAIGDGFECRLQIGERLHAIDFGGLDEGGDDAPVAAPFVMTGKQRVFSCQGQRADQVLNGIGVDLDTPVLQEDLEPLPVAGDIAEFLAETGFGRDPSPLLIEPDPEGFNPPRAIAWNLSIRQRASTSMGTPASMAAMVTVSDLLR